MVTIFSSKKPLLKGGSSNVEMGQTFTDLIQQSLGHVFVVPIYESALEKAKLISTDSMFVKVRLVPKKGECGPRRVDFNL